MPAAETLLLDSFSALADPTRCRTLLLLERHELTVSELCTILQLPQSTVSRHLKTLADAGLVSSRRDGTSRYYTLAATDAQTAAAQLWQITRNELAGRASAAQDLRRLERVLAGRSETSEQFFASAAGQWDQLRDDLFGRDFLWRALLSLLPSNWTVGDLGCGTGAVLTALAPHVANVIGIDGSEEMLATARARTRDLGNVALHRGTLEALPLESATLDAATLVLVLHHVPAPALALAEAARVLKPGGRLLIVDMAPHDHEEYRAQMGHVWLGFADDQMRRLLAQAGFERIHIHHLTPVADARGPSLISATGVVRSK